VSKKVLGKGIDALFSSGSFDKSSDTKIGMGVITVPLKKIKHNPRQPRETFNEESLKELAESIRNQGIIQPILVEERRGEYTIVAGERRFRAAEIAQLEEVPVIVKTFSDDEKLEIALIENIQREDLTPIEEAKAYLNLMRETGLSQEQIAAKVGKKRSTIANSLRLLKLPDDMQGAVSEGKISPGHARAIMSVTDSAGQRVLFLEIVSRGLSVREAERKAEELNGKKNRSASPPARDSFKEKNHEQEPEIKTIEQKLIHSLGTKVTIKGDIKRGKVEILYFSMDDLERIYNIICGKD